MVNKYFVSSYATSPSFYAWNEDNECDYFKQLQTRAEIVGIEHPFLLNSNKYPLSWMLKNIPTHWKIMITMLPAFMEASKSNVNLGLASASEPARIQAIALMEQVSQYITKLNDSFGRQIVQAVHFHSSPKNEIKMQRGNKIALQRSLEDIKLFSWDKAQLNLEHCDTLIPGQVPDKGFLSLHEELEVLSTVGGYGVVLNWARSAIECRSIQGPLQHITQTAKKGLLKGFFFSGCTANAQNAYGNWRDTHMPPKNFINNPYLEPDSLLGYGEINQALALLNNNEYLGVKVLNPSKEPCIKKSVGLNVATIEALDHVAGCIVEEVNL